MSFKTAFEDDLACMNWGLDIMSLKMFIIKSEVACLWSAAKSTYLLACEFLFFMPIIFSWKTLKIFRVVLNPVIWYGSCFDIISECAKFRTPLAPSSVIWLKLWCSGVSRPNVMSRKSLFTLRSLSYMIVFIVELKLPWFHHLSTLRKLFCLWYITCDMMMLCWRMMSWYSSFSFTCWTYYSCSYAS